MERGSYRINQIQKKEESASFENYLEQQIILNEQFRSAVLLLVIGSIAGYLGIILILYHRFFDRTNSLQALSWLGVILIFLFFRTFNIRRMIRKRLLFGKRLKPVILYFNVLIELSIPSLAIILLAQLYNPMVALLSPAVFIYFIFILLSVLELNFSLSLISGIMASVQYLTIVFLYLGVLKSVTNLEVFSVPFIYIGKALIILLAGLIAGLTARLIRRRTLIAYHASTERLRIQKIFGQQMSPQIVEELINSKQKIVSRHRQVCIMFLDLRGFTQYCEGRTPEEIVDYQNQVLSFMIDAVVSRRGIINQILGDGFMATFGAPISSNRDCDNAVESALDIVYQLDDKLQRGELSDTYVGIGIHFGDAVTGNVGTGTRQQYSITGNVVILASRLEQMNKQFNSRVLISREVLEQIDTDQLTIDPLGKVIIKGRSMPMEIFKLA